MLDYLLGFRWLRAQTIASPQPPVPPPGRDRESLILQLCQRPQTLGALRDATGLPYRELNAVLGLAIANGKLKTLFLPVGDVRAIHYQTTQPIPAYGHQTS